MNNTMVKRAQLKKRLTALVQRLKTAAPEYADTAMAYARANPRVVKGLAAAGGGALAYGAGKLMERKDPESPNIASKALKGLGGAAMLGGAGYAASDKVMEAYDLVKRRIAERKQALAALLQRRIAERQRVEELRASASPGIDQAVLR